MFSQGVRMILGGDEIGRTQNGNNNPYCQDSEISWVNWDVGETGTALRDFTRDLIKIVEDNPILRRRDFFTGKPIGDQARDVMWVRPDGEMMTDEDWQDSENRSIGMLVPGRAADEVDVRGRLVKSDTLLLLLNASSRSRSWTLPRLEWPGRWEELLSTARPGENGRTVRTSAVNLTAHSSLLLRHNERLDE
jgi:isoamylase